MDMRPKFKEASSIKRRGLSMAVVVFLSVGALWGCSSNENKSAGASKEAADASAKSASSIDVKAAGSLEAGKKVYNKYCHFCHGMEGRGDGPVSIGISPHPADFTTDTKRMSKTDAELLKSLNDGIKREIGGEAMFMPSWKTILTEQEKVDVLAYVRFLSQQGKKEADKATSR
ncbi:MAG: hypothetical protein A3J24_02825 [Deltaproteobacteria bacterium RIFCSPLOWO2_02_FULL_53_8]|nr:MAG: hypothetical protein A3J24_02825 [Deltaproteobacteria bacterium RIFCSPLOWO2_02_FULL_53_8]